MSWHRYNFDYSHTEGSCSLDEINQHLKAVLTELLNMESVRSEEKYRSYLQKLLLDIEQQRRKQRRRDSRKDWAMAASIAAQLQRHGIT